MVGILLLPIYSLIDWEIFGCAYSAFFNVALAIKGNSARFVIPFETVKKCPLTPFFCKVTFDGILKVTGLFLCEWL